MPEQRNRVSLQLVQRLSIRRFARGAVAAYRQRQEDKRVSDDERQTEPSPAADARPFGEMLRAYRTQKQLSLRDLEKKIDVPSATLSRLENGKDPDVDTFLRILAWMFGRHLW
jgi:ribosome-binding protein aMBF1 (putative translation factor)